jgi:hypothetical protein
MTRFVVGDFRSQSTLFPSVLEDYGSDDNPVRAFLDCGIRMPMRRIRSGCWARAAGGHAGALATRPMKSRLRMLPPKNSLCAASALDGTPPASDTIH